MKITRIRGKKAVISKLNAVDNIVKSGIVESLKYGGYLLRDKAIENLINLSKEPGLSQDGESITLKSNWIVAGETPNSIKVECISEHAAVVELGGESTGTTLVRMTKGSGYPIGKQQYGQASFGPDPITGVIKPIIRKEFLIQQPKSYFRSAYNSGWVKESMRNRIKRDISKNIRSIL